jgi:hypothetical protein
MAWQERPSLWMIDNDRVAEAKGYRAAHLPGVLRDFRQLRRETLLLLRALPAASWARVGLHPRRGEVTIEDQAGVLADHGEHHVARLARA